MLNSKKVPFRRKLGNRIKYVEEVLFYHASPLTPLRDEEKLNETKFFCLNSGNCGSTYMVDLLRKNGIENCHHEQRPDFNLLGSEYFVESTPDPQKEAKLVKMMQVTRKNTFFEASNRLFALTPIIEQSFPNAKFIHLHRNGQETVRSILSRPYLTDFFTRYTVVRNILSPFPKRKTNFEKACLFWNTLNKTILDDLKNHDHLSLPFKKLVNGDLVELESFMHIKIKRRKEAKVNGTKFEKVRKFDEWPEHQKQIFWDICGDTMERMGYA